MPIDPENDPTPISLAEFFWQDFMPSFAQMQSRTMANQFILVEMLRDLTRQHDDPTRYLAALYDRVVGRWEQAGSNKNPVGDANFREAVEAVLMKAGKTDDHTG